MLRVNIDNSPATIANTPDNILCFLIKIIATIVKIKLIANTIKP